MYITRAEIPGEEKKNLNYDKNRFENWSFKIGLKK